MRHSRLHLVLGVLACLGATLVALPAPAPAATTASDFSIARLHYGGGGDWYGNQSSLRNLLAGVRERLQIPLASAEESVVQPLDEALFRHPFLFVSGHGNVKFTPAEVDRLRAYFEAGGFLWCDDDYGIDASFRREMQRVFPDKQFVELPFDHDLFRAPYRFERGLPKIHEHDGGPPRAFALFHKGRVAVLYTFDTDLGDGLEDAGTHPDPAEKREAALQMALNIVAYSLTH